ncbi:MAG: exodeoxyribonuclease VII large subunit [Tannerella sp.]|jgi:exodeoxyribonuclease VII large subunit|nr:exodeoxyribonuclease VII large subunit [Tannerella sp.]
MHLFNNIDSSDALSLSQLNEQVHKAISESLPEVYWVRAETSDVRINASSGHCYLEFVEKDPRTEQIIAKARGTIWARTFHILKPYFEETTRQSFVSGLKVLVKVSVEFHKLYGYSLTVHDIDPSYTLGDLVQKRMEIIRRLQQEGIFDLNKELPLSGLPQRIAVITSPTAAGYEDFLNQLIHNKAGYAFYVKLFPAIMQGEKTEESIIEALDQVWQYSDHFDAVVIIRGGGSASDLNCFDSYMLAAHCAQFPIPVITGIGHERDDSIVDMVAHTRMKTPTAVAAFLISLVDEQAEALDELQQTLCAVSTEIIASHKNELTLMTTKLPVSVTYQLERNRNKLLALKSDLSGVNLLILKQKSLLSEIRQSLQNTVSNLVTGQNHILKETMQTILNTTRSLLAEKRQAIELLDQFVRLASPAYILKRGYTLTLKDGKIVKKASELKTGDEIVTQFSDGKQKAVIK